MEIPSTRDYVWRTTKWFFGNLIFGLAPLIFMSTVWTISNNALGDREIHDLVHEGAVLFVLIAIMGSVLLDYMQSGYKFTGHEIFTIFIAPFIVLSVICLNYLFICLKVIGNDRFDLNSDTTIFVGILSTAYCIFQKTSLYMREDIKNREGGATIKSFKTNIV